MTRIQLCGRLKADVEGRHVTPALRGRQGRVLLAYLVLNRGRPVSRDELIDAIWPDNPPADPPAALRTQLSRLRSALGTKALAGRDTIELRLPENTWIDVEAAEHAIQAAEAALSASDWKDAWAHAHISLNITGRPLLAGFDAPWLDEARRELTELQMRARESIARAGVGLGGSELASAERSARELIRGAPFRESGYLNLMKALAASGNTAEALRTYEQLRRLLADELGTAPGAEVLALHRRLLQSGSDALTPGVEAPPKPAPRADPDELPLPTWLTPRRHSPFVGRTLELKKLDELWAEASGGDRQIVFVSGDPGVGKTRLATMHAQLVHAGGGRVLYGRADEDTNVNYQPFVEAMRHWAINAPAPELRRDLGPHAAVLARLVPEITARIPQPPQLDPEEHARDRFFDAVTGTLAAIAAANPTLLVIDDLHWADQGSLLMLRHIVRSPHRSGLMILGTYRGTEISDALAETLADLGRERLFERIDLDGLGAEDVRRLVASVVGGKPNPRLARAIHAETRGNPFLVEALVQNLPEEGADWDRPAGYESMRAALYAGGVPSLVREAVSHRAADLGDNAEPVLEVASVIGRDFESEFLVEVSDLPAERVIEALEAAVGAGLLVDVPGTMDAYAFSHSLFRQAVYSGLSKARRAALHNRLAEALERRHGTDPRHVAELARHFAGAGSGAAPKAVEYCVRAGASALGALAYEEAIDHYSRALTAIEAASSNDEMLRCEVLLGLGEAEWRAGGAGAARETFLRAARIGRRAGDSSALARAALGFGGYSWERFGLRDAEAEELLEEAIDAKPADPVLRSRLSARLAEALYFSDEPERAANLSEDALKTARASGDRAALAAALVGRWYACFRPEGLVERNLLTDELESLSAVLRDRDLSIQTRMLRVIVSLEQGEIEMLDHAIEEHARLADQTKQPSYQLHGRAFRAMRALMEGRFEDVEGLAGEVLELGALAQSPNALHYSALNLYLLRWEQGRLAEMEEALRDLIDQFSVPAWQAAQVLLFAELEKNEEARQGLGVLAEDGWAALPRDATWLAALGFLALACAKLGESERGAELYELMLPFEGRIVMAGGAGAYSSSTSHYLGLLAGMDGRPGDAVRHLEDAVAIDRRTGARPWMAGSQHRLAIALHARDEEGDRERARQLLSDAVRTAEELGMTRLLKLARNSERAVSATA